MYDQPARISARINMGYRLSQNPEGAEAMVPAGYITRQGANRPGLSTHDH
jgi:hypothetical protein